MASNAPERRTADFEALFSDTHGRLRAYVLRRGASAVDADDVVADVYVVAWRRFDDLPSDALPWLIGVARNVHRNQQRSRRRSDALLDRLRNEPLPDRGSDGDDALDIAAVRQALTGLSADDRDLLQLAVIEGLSSTQIAQVLGCRPVTARVRLHRARTRLRALVDRRPGGQPTLARSERSDA